MPNLIAIAVPHGFDGESHVYAAVVRDGEGRIVRTSAPYRSEADALAVADRSLDREEAKRKRTKKGKR